LVSAKRQSIPAGCRKIAQNEVRCGTQRTKSPVKFHSHQDPTHPFEHKEITNSHPVASQFGDSWYLAFETSLRVPENALRELANPRTPRSGRQLASFKKKKNRTFAPKRVQNAYINQYLFILKGLSVNQASNKGHLLNGNEGAPITTQ
jgi:hypothetical protein